MDNIKYQSFSEELFKNTITAVIDADSFAYAIGWNHKDTIFGDAVLKDVDELVHDILQGTQARHYVGILSPDVQTVPGQLPEITKPNFRKAIGVSRPYKGMRKEKPEWYDTWAPIIHDHLITQWGFIKAPEGLEADDLAATMCKMITDLGGNATCCGNDKDLLQIPGNHFNIVKKTLSHIPVSDACFRLWNQVLMGDSTDNIEGLPGCGKVMSEKILGPTTARYAWPLTEQAYITSVIGSFIGTYPNTDIAIRKFYENYMLVKLRTDIDLELVDEAALRGYDLNTYNKLYQSIAEEAEDVPDFGRQEEELNFGKDGIS